MTLAEFVGNAHVKKAVAGMFASGRIPHAIVIEGEAGLGKHTLAGIIAGAAVCGESNPPCGVCQDCTLAQKGIHPDISVIAPDGMSVKVEQVRSLRQAAYILPNQARSRVFIIDGADKMNDYAANAILKVLEEPPAHVLFLLIAESAEKLLPTIISRSVVLSLSPPDEHAAADYLEKCGLPNTGEEIRAAVMTASGNIGLALTVLKSGNSEWVFTDQILDAVENGGELDLLRLLYTLEGKKGRERIRSVLNELQGKIERLICAKTTGQQRMQTAGMKIPLPKLARMRGAVMAAAEQNASNAGTALLLTNLCACFESSLDV